MVNHMPQSITAFLNYFIDAGEKPVNAHLGVGPEELRLKVWNSDARGISLLNGGVAEEEFDLDVYGFAFVQHPIQTKNFYDVEELKSVYYPEIEQLIKDQMGALRLLIFDHTLRNGDDDLRARLGTREQVKSVQNDYTEWSGPQYVRDLLADEAEGFLSRRMAVVQATIALPPDPERIIKHTAILTQTPTLKPNASAVLKFTAPKTKGIYPYVCTLPGHGLLMYGAMYVGETMPDLAKDEHVPPMARAKGANSNLHAWPHRRPLMYRIFMPDASPAAIATGQSRPRAAE